MQASKIAVQLVIASMWLTMVSCGSDGGGEDAITDPGQDTQKDVKPDVPVEDKGIDDCIDQKDVPGDVPADLPKDTEIGKFGFKLRVPQEHSIDCKTPFGGDKLDAWDWDWVCTFEYGGTSGHIYVQATPVDCIVTMSAIPVFESLGAWISADGAVSELAGPYYDWGGNHNNDFLEFDHAGKHHKYYHSSLGSGWRKCENMDCIQVYDTTGTTLEEDGCTKERTLPAACVAVDHSGNIPELVDVETLGPDKWPCPGDPNYQ